MEWNPKTAARTKGSSSFSLPKSANKLLKYNTCKTETTAWTKYSKEHA